MKSIFRLILLSPELFSLAYQLLRNVAPGTTLYATSVVLFAVGPAHGRPAMRILRARDAAVPSSVFPHLLTVGGDVPGERIFFCLRTGKPKSSNVSEI